MCFQEKEDKRQINHIFFVIDHILCLCRSKQKQSNAERKKSEDNDNS
jgi:hypothetical protein